MRRNRLLLSGTGVAAAGLVIFAAFGFHKDGRSLYHPSADAEKFEIAAGEEEEFEGAARWRFDRIKNNVTGDLDYADMLSVNDRATQTLNAARQGGPQQTTSAVQWNEIGPDNVGGRTRTILIDRNNSQHIYAGAVSGGLWESNDGANNWHRVSGFFNVAGVNINVVTIAQASNNDLYVGTGEGNFYAPFGTGAGGFIGGGIYKSTDGGVTWALLASTAPSAANSTNANWADVNKVAVDPNDPNHVYAGTNKGLKISSDGGATWVAASGPSTAAVCTDIEVTNNGRVVAVVTAKPWLSTDNGATFTNVSGTGTGFATVNLSRTEVDIAPSDPNYVYAFCAASSGAMAGVYVSINGGSNWTQVCGAGNAQFDPFSANGQGSYDNIVTVDPTNPGRAIFGGVELWEWEMVTNNPPAGQWTRIALEFTSTLNPFYVHSDKHEIVFDLQNPNIFYIGCDGGIFRTLNNGYTYQPMNSGYNVTQCYTVAFDHQTLNRDIAVAGCQDNGTQYVNHLGNTPMSADAVGGGDGGHCDMSYLNPAAMFGTVYYGALARSNNNGASSSQFYDARIQGLTNFGNPGFASFVTPIRLWETANDVLTADSVLVINNKMAQNVTVTTATTGATFTGTLGNPAISSNPLPTVVLDSVMFACGGDTLYSDAAGVITGDGTGTVNTNGTYTITFNTAPGPNLILKVWFDLQFGAGTTFFVSSTNTGRPITYVNASTLPPGDTLKVQDIMQSHLAVGFTSSVFMTRQAINFSTTPLWVKIAGNHSTPSAFSGETSCMAWSTDGNMLYVGTAGGNVYRIYNIAPITDSINGDVDNNTAANPDAIERCRLIGNFGGRPVTGIDVDPSDAGRVIVSLGNYSNTQYVYFSQSADTASSVSAAAFVDKTGNLDNIGGVPVYSITWDKYSTNRVLVATEHGVFETTNISAVAPSWTAAMSGLDNVVVDQIRQQRWEPWLVPNSGCFYIGTHGRGMWRDDSSWQQPTGIGNPTQPSVNTAINNNDLKVFPNPVVENSNVTFRLDKAGDVTVQIFDLTGKVVFSRNYEQLNAGANTVEFQAGNLVKGTYLILVSQGAKRVGTGRFIKMD